MSNAIIEKYLHGLKVKPDELTAVERGELLSRGEQVDRIPCCIDTGKTLAPMLGYSIKDYQFSAEKMCELELYIYETFHSDSAGLSTTLRGMAEAMGTKVAYFDNNIAHVEENAISSLDEVDKLDLIDPMKDGRLHIVLKGLEMVKEKLGDKVPVSGSVTGPFTIAAMLVGTENLLVGMVRKPEKVHQLMDLVVENNNRYLQRMIDIGVGIGFCDPVSSTTLIRPRLYREFSLPYFQKNVDYIKAHGGGCGLHICGASRKIWEDIAGTGIGGFSLDNIEDLAEAKEVLGPHMAIMGNIPPVDVLRFSTPQDVLRSGRDCIRKAWDSPNGFTLTSGRQSPVGTPAENLQAIMDCTRIFGRYSIDIGILQDDE